MKFQLGMVGFVLISAVGVARGANILGVFFTHSPSHVIVHMATVRALVDRGHNVTVLTSMPLNDPNPGYRHIYLKELEYRQEELDALFHEFRNATIPQLIIKSFQLALADTEKSSNYVKAPAFIKFIEEGNQFDLMILGYIYNEFQLGIAAHFKCPTVLSWMIQPIGHVSRLIGNPTLPAVVPQAPFMDPGPMTFKRRVLSFITGLVERLIMRIITFILESRYNKNYPPDKYPTLTEMKRNISLVLFNHHFSEGPIRPLVPGLVEIGGIQIKDKPDPLPEDIETFLKNSPQGAILFSLGTNIREEHLGANAFQIIYNAISSLPYNTIWKFVNGQQKGNASNILFKKWLPQDDILAHKNLKLFVTHAGKGGITESEYHGVPMVAIPVMGDQPSNAKTLVRKGHGVVLDYNKITEESLRQAIVEVMESESYRSAVRKFSNLYRDRPLTARENAVFWIEYVIRHRGAPHMQSPLRTLNILQENSIDVILFLILILYGTFQILKIFFRMLPVIFRRLWKIGKPKNKVE